MDHESAKGQLGAIELARYVHHPKVELWSTDPSSPQRVIVGAYDSARDLLHFRFDTDESKGMGGVQNCSNFFAGIPRLIALGYPATELDLRQALHPFAVAVELGADAIVTGGLLLQLRESGLPGLWGTTVVTPEEALALVGLKLRGDEEISIPYGSGAEFSVNRSMFYRLMILQAVPSLPAWHEGCHRIRNRSVERAAAAVGVRLRHALRARDEIQGAAQFGETTRLEEVMYSLDMLLVSMAGAFDAAAFVANHMFGVGSPPPKIAWWNRDWTSRLSKRAADVAVLVLEGSRGRGCLNCLVELRNLIHGDVLRSWHMQEGGLVRRCFEIPERERRVGGANQLVRDIVWTSADLAGGAASWGLERTPKGEVFLDPDLYVEQLTDSCLVLLDALLDETVKGAVPPDAPQPVAKPPRLFVDDIHWSLCYLGGAESGLS